MPNRSSGRELVLNKGLFGHIMLLPIIKRKKTILIRAFIKFILGKYLFHSVRVFSLRKSKSIYIKA